MVLLSALTFDCSTVLSFLLYLLITAQFVELHIAQANRPLFISVNTSAGDRTLIRTIIAAGTNVFLVFHFLGFPFLSSPFSGF